MATATHATKTANVAVPHSLDDVVQGLGGIPLSRILAKPAPGTATESDVLESQRIHYRLYELVDGVLVEKAMRLSESLLAGALIHILRNFVVPRNLGVVSAPDGVIRLFSGLIRIPDVAFVSWDRFPDRKIPSEPIPTLAPDLVIEVLSRSNTVSEMQRKRAEFFAAGVKLIWGFDPELRVLDVYTPDGSVTRLMAGQTLDGGDVLVRFVLDLGELFGDLDRHG